MIIAQTLKYIAGVINAFYDNPVSAGVDELVVLGNISRIDSDSGTGSAELTKKVILSLINLEEEKTLKNSPFNFRQGDALLKRNPTLYLNLYVLFSCADEDYEQALIKIGRIVSFFQQQYVFTGEGATGFPEDVEKLIFDLFSPNFEQINHLWGILGGKYVPSALYKIRLLPVQASPGETVAAVRDITANGNLR